MLSWFEVPASFVNLTPSAASAGIFSWASDPEAYEQRVGFSQPVYIAMWMITRYGVSCHHLIMYLVGDTKHK